MGIKSIEIVKFGYFTDLSFRAFEVFQRMKSTG